MKRCLLFLAGLLLVSIGNTTVLGCAACFGATDSKLAEGMNWGILSLLAVVGAVLATIASFFVFIVRRAAAVDAAAMASESMTSTTSKV